MMIGDYLTNCVKDIRQCSCPECQQELELRVVKHKRRRYLRHLQEYLKNLQASPYLHRKEIEEAQQFLVELKALFEKPASRQDATTPSEHSLNASVSAEYSERHSVR